MEGKGPSTNRKNWSPGHLPTGHQDIFRQVKHHPPQAMGKSFNKRMTTANNDVNGTEGNWHPVSSWHKFSTRQLKDILKERGVTGFARKDKNALVKMVVESFNA